MGPGKVTGRVREPMFDHREWKRIKNVHRRDILGIIHKSTSGYVGRRGEDPYKHKEVRLIRDKLQQVETCLGKKVGCDHVY